MRIGAFSYYTQLVCRNALVIGLGVGLLLPGFCAKVYADASQPQATLDLRILLDNSGSMERSDPDGHRFQALGLISQLLPDKTMAGVWMYGAQLRPLIPHGLIDTDWLTRLRLQSAQVKSSDLRTRLVEALEKVALQSSESAQIKSRHILLITDGGVDVSEDVLLNGAQEVRLIKDILPKLRRRGIKVHTITLSDRANTALLRQISLATGAFHAHSDVAESLPGLVLRALDQMSPSLLAPLSRSQGFLIDPSVKEFSAIIIPDGQGPHTLLTPAGEVLSQSSASTKVHWIDSKAFTLVRVTDPAVGSWQLMGSVHSDNTVRVDSNLQIQFVAPPANSSAGFSGKFKFSLVSEDGTDISQALLSTIAYQAQLRAPAGLFILPIRPVDGQNPDGEHFIDIPQLYEPGAYEIKISARSGLIEREISRWITLRSAITVSLVAQENRNALVRVDIADAEVEHASIRVLGRFEEGKNKSLLVAGKDAQGAWVKALPSVEGKSSIYLEISGNYLNNNNKISLSYGPVVFFMPLDKNQTLRMNLDGTPVLPRAIYQLEEISPDQEIEPVYSYAPADFQVNDVVIDPVLALNLASEAELGHNGGIPAWIYFVLGGGVNLLGVAALWFFVSRRKKQSQPAETVVHELEARTSEVLDLLGGAGISGDSSAGDGEESIADNDIPAKEVLSESATNAPQEEEKEPEEQEQENEAAETPKETTEETPAEAVEEGSSQAEEQPVSQDETKEETEEETKEETEAESEEASDEIKLEDVQNEIDDLDNVDNLISKLKEGLSTDLDEIEAILGDVGLEPIEEDEPDSADEAEQETVSAGVD